MAYKVGEIVEVIDNLIEHGFEIGEQVRIIKVDKFGEPDEAENLAGTIDWCIVSEDIKKLEEE